MPKMTVHITRMDAIRPAFTKLFRYASELVAGSVGLKVTVQTKRIRTLDQNAKMWAMLHDVAGQIQWPVNGKMEWLKPEEWKSIFSAAADSEMRMAQGLTGGFVFLGKRTSDMSVQQMGDLIECMYAFGVERDLKWSDPMPQGWAEIAEQN